MTDLGGGYTARRITLESYREACARLEDRIFGGNWLYSFGPAAKAPPPLGENFSWGVYCGTELVGWSHAHQRDERTVYMADTGLLPEHQGRGLYTRLLPALLETFRTAGYTLVQSHHRATNNRVIVPKLRAGFLVQGLSLYEGGLNVALTLSLDPAYQEAQHIRSGFRAPDARGARGEAARRLGLEPAGTRRPAPLPPLRLPESSGPGEDLGGGYSLHPVSYEVYYDIYTQLEQSAYSSVSFDWPAPGRLEAPAGRRYAWLIGHQGEVAGWQMSRQWDRRTAYMVNTALLPAHRGQGVYSRLLPVVLRALEAEGYDLVRSHHHATNNAVLVPKLRAGFCLQGLQVDDHGVMAVLMLSFSEAYREAMHVRSGLLKPHRTRGAGLGLTSRKEG
ncbi:GNAT family N-acetyltransferase [Deinococcus deserti]|uniref:GNAT family N-acetyltransferase n=1 Tax=Deinococcus deserti TaxID=310783 RepID=UPI000319AD98|nr:GNAT family N-acetyltransferase [Deinococcus deserti]